jgi:hypothetical protein
MRAYRDIPIKQKLLIMIMVTTTTALLLAGLGIILTDSLLFRQYLRRDLSALAKIIADNSTAALAFNDPPCAPGITWCALVSINPTMPSSPLTLRTPHFLVRRSIGGTKSGSPAGG